MRNNLNTSALSSKLNFPVPFGNVLAWLLCNEKQRLIGNSRDSVTNILKIILSNVGKNDITTLVIDVSLNLLNTEASQQ